MRECVLCVLCNCLVCVLTCDLAGIVEGDVIVATVVLQLLLFLQQSHAHQVEHLYTHITQGLPHTVY